MAPEREEEQEAVSKVRDMEPPLQTGGSDGLATAADKQKPSKQVETGGSDGSAAATEKQKPPKRRRKERWSFACWLAFFSVIGALISFVSVDQLVDAMWHVRSFILQRPHVPFRPRNTQAAGAGGSPAGCPFHFGKPKLESSHSHHQSGAGRGDKMPHSEGSKGGCPFHSGKGKGERKDQARGEVPRGHTGVKSAAQSLNVPVIWMAPFVSGGGYSSEAISYAEALHGQLPAGFQAIQHGDAVNMHFVRGLPERTQQLLGALFEPSLDPARSIVICHSEPGAWNPPLYQTTPCPPAGPTQPRYVIGRTMFETDRVTPKHVERINRMDEVWVPTHFHVGTFERSGVDPAKMVVVPQAVDVEFFSPATPAIDLPVGERIFGPDVPPGWGRLPAWVGHGAKGREEAKEPFVFLSIFKWEARKGWDVLVRAYLQEFSAGDNVVLYLLTNPYHSDRNFAKKIREFVREQGCEEPPSGWPSVHVNHHHVPQGKLPGLYKRAGAFVLPSRGEGWGRPHVEAMAMSLPVIATNWSGMTEYMTEENSYPLPLDGFAEVEEGPFQGHLWAKPSVAALQMLMRHVFLHQDEAREKGKKARADMVRRFAPEVVAGEVMAHLVRIEKSLAVS